MAYLYRHIRLDENIPFYVGIGSDNTRYKRAFDKDNRNASWWNVVNNTKYEVEILLEDIPVSEIIEKECEFIKLYGREDRGVGTLVNMTDGGDGRFGHTPSEETRKKMSLALTGRKHTDEAKKKISQCALGNKRTLGFKKSIEQIRKTSDKLKGRPLGEQNKINLAKSHYTFTKEDVYNMKELRDSGWTYIDIAKLYKRCRTSVTRIIKNQKYKYINL